MTVVQIGDQEQRFSVDGDGNLIHRWYVPPAPAIATHPAVPGAWHREVLQGPGAPADLPPAVRTGCVPHAAVDIDPHYIGDGYFHVYADKVDGTQAHSFWDNAKWAHEVNP